MKIVKSNKPDYESPQVQIELMNENVLLASIGIDYDFDQDTKDWD